MTIIRATDMLKCKLMAGKLKDVPLHLYMSLPRFSIISYQDLGNKMIH